MSESLPFYPVLGDPVVISYVRFSCFCVFQTGLLLSFVSAVAEFLRLRHLPSPGRRHRDGRGRRDGHRGLSNGGLLSASGTRR